MNAEALEACLNQGYVPFTIGIENYGNTCYVNAIMQCLFQVKSLVPIFLNQELTAISERCLPADMLRGFQRILCTGFQNKYSANAMQQFLNAVYKSFEKGTQHDAHEFLLHLFNTIADNLQISKHMSSTFKKDGYDVYGAIEVAQQWVVQCYVDWKQTTVCKRGHRSELVYKGNILDLDVKGENHLEACIAKFFEPIRFSSCSCHVNKNKCNAYNCKDCDQHVEAIQTKILTNLPDVLIIQLKRFEQVGYGVVSLN